MGPLKLPRCSIFVIRLLLAFILALSTATSNAATSITQHGITWVFDGDYTTGQFINGDYWVLDAGEGVKITNISPGHAVHPTSGRHMNGSMVNPHNMPQGYDGQRDYDQTKNVGIGVNSSTPLVLSGDVSLVSTISNVDDAGVNHKSYVKTASVLTCLAAAPSSGSFRPGISSTVKILHNGNTLDFSKLKNLPCPLGVTKPNMEIYANYFRMVWLDHGGWTTRFMRPSDGIPDNYYYTAYFTTASLMLNLDYSNQEKKNLLVNFIQLGIDLYSLIERGQNYWEPDGGNMNGRKWPILFAGIMIGYDPMQNIGYKSGDYLYSNGHGPGNPPADYIHFGEDGQTFYVAQSDIDVTNGATWSPDTRSAPNYPYTSAMIGMPEWAIRHSTKPHVSDSSWNAMYRTINAAASSWAGDVIAIRFLNAKELWNNKAYFDYVDRYMAITKGSPDPFGYKVYSEKVGGRPAGLIGAMWDTYRHLYDRRLFRNVRVGEVAP